MTYSAAAPMLLKLIAVEIVRYQTVIQLFLFNFIRRQKMNNKKD